MLNVSMYIVLFLSSCTVRADVDNIYPTSHPIPSPREKSSVEPLALFELCLFKLRANNGILNPPASSSSTKHPLLWFIYFP